MSTAPDPRFFDQQLSAFTSYAGLCTAAVLDVRGGPRRPGFGSGTCIKVANRIFVATAAHVLDDCSIHDLVVAVRSHDEARVYLKPIKFGRRGGGDSFDDTDIAWIEVEAFKGISAVPLERVLLTGKRPHKSVVVVVGTPEHRAHSTTDVESVRISGVDIKITWNLQTLGWATNLVQDVDWPTNISAKYSPATHYMLEYSAVTEVGSGTSLGLIAPHGMSGGGIWMLPVEAETADLWTSNKGVLAGIQTGYIPSKNVLCGNRIELWAALMLKDHPELAPHFQSITASMP